ncbi:Maelstrom spermatogenic transposon silencer, partial [Pristimantis euphronides]
MPNKKASRNAYFFFALDMMPELRRRGHKVSGVKEAIALCSGDWALLTAEERDRYTEKAKKWKSQDPEPPRQRIEEPAAARTHTTATCAQYKYQTCLSHVVFVDLDKCVIYILDIFSHGEMPRLCDQRFVPCEIGCVRYSLQTGIMDSLHDFIDPGELPLGFRYHCQAGSLSTHQIPVSGFELANRDYYNLFSYLCDFVCPASKCYTSVYCKNNDLHRVKWCLEWLAYKAGMENPFELQDIESLIIKFYKDKLNEEPSRSSVHRLLDVVQWDYANNTRCKWHEDNDMWYCALASCKKVTYCISRSLASVYGVVLTSAHLPNLQPKDKQKSVNCKTVVLDAKRYQKKDLTEYRTSVDPVGGEHSLGMRGVNAKLTSKTRGRGILRLLEDDS